jgi:hypothetical protein
MMGVCSAVYQAQKIFRICHHGKEDGLSPGWDVRSKNDEQSWYP